MRHAAAVCARVAFGCSPRVASTGSAVHSERSPPPQCFRAWVLLGGAGAGTGWCWCWCWVVLARVLSVCRHRRPHRDNLQGLLTHSPAAAASAAGTLGGRVGQKGVRRRALAQTWYGSCACFPLSRAGRTRVSLPACRPPPAQRGGAGSDHLRHRHGPRTLGCCPCL